jgi:hypothetical protein
MLTIRARVFSVTVLADNYSRIQHHVQHSPGAHTFDSDSPRRATVLWIRFVSLLVGAASGNPRFSTSSFPLALPLGASSSTVHATGDRAKARVGTMVGTPGITHFSPAGAGLSATQVARHPLMRTLYTLDSCVMKHSVSRSRLSARDNLSP